MQSALARPLLCAMTDPLREQPPLQLLSVVIPARDEAGCIAATVEHLHVELRLNNVPHEIPNAFKAYRRQVIDGCRPYLSPRFNVTVEIPLKAIVRGYTWTVIPITWRNRRTGTAKLKIKEMGSRYLFICLYIWLEKYFSRGDYQKTSEPSE